VISANVIESSDISFLYSLQRFGIKLGLRNITKLLQRCENPHNNFPSIHIAGTNGKGSTAAMLASIFTAAGYKTGLYTSPHLLSVYERIRINGNNISSQKFSSLVQEFRNDIIRFQATFFEAVTAIAFQYFSIEKVDIAIIETGLGGRLDATNVLSPILSIITNISLDHAEQLGDTLPSIAKEKAGIIKQGIPCITGVEDRQSLNVLKRISKSKSAPLWETKDAISIQEKSIGIENNVYSVDTPFNSFSRLNVSLGGYFQTQNVATALLAIDVLRNKQPLFLSKKFSISIENIKMGMNHISRFTNFTGRLQVISHSPLIVLDVAHNPDAMNRLTYSVRHLFPKRGAVVFGAMRDKDVSGMLDTISTLNIPVIAVQPKIERAITSREILEMCHRKKIRCFDGGDVENGIRQALSTIPSSEYLMVCGSFYVCGEAMKMFDAV